MQTLLTSTGILCALQWYKLPMAIQAIQASHQSQFRTRAHQGQFNNGVKYSLVWIIICLLSSLQPPIQRYGVINRPYRNLTAPWPYGFIIDDAREGPTWWRGAACMGASLLWFLLHNYVNRLLRGHDARTSYKTNKWEVEELVLRAGTTTPFIIYLYRI